MKIRLASINQHMNSDCSPSGQLILAWQFGDWEKQTKEETRRRTLADGTEETYTETIVEDVFVAKGSFGQMLPDPKLTGINLETWLAIRGKVAYKAWVAQTEREEAARLKERRIKEYEGLEVASV